MELKTLKYFVYVAEARSFSNAAIQLRVAQPALSRQISRLETEIGHRLFLRTGRRLELTEAGERLLVRAHGLLRQAQNTLEEVRIFGTDLSGTINIGLSPAVCEVLAPIILRECAVQYPNLTVQFVEGFSGVIFEQLLNQELTLCLLHNPPIHKSIDIHPLVHEAMCLVGPPPGCEWLEPAGPGMALGALPMILPDRTHPLRRVLDDALGGEQLKVKVQTNGVITTRALVAAGYGYTILPYSAAYTQVQRGQLSCVRIENLHIPWTLSLASRTDQRSVRPVNAVLEVLRANMDAITQTDAPTAAPGTRVSQPLPI